MAAMELMRNYNTRYCVFYIDTLADAALLPTSKTNGTGEMALSTPCRAGSIARDMTGQLYTLNGNDEWVKYQASSGAGSGSGEMPDLDIATDQEIQDMLDDVFNWF